MIILGIDLAQYPYLNALILGTVWSIYGYFTSTTATTFKLIKLGATIVTAVFTVTLLYSAGVPIEQATFEQQIVLFGFVTVAAERALTKIADWLSKKPAVQSFFIRRLQGITGNGIEFDVKFTGSNVAPAQVSFTDEIGNITRWDFGNGHMYDPDPNERVIMEMYTKPGTYIPKAMCGTVELYGDPLKVLDGTPLPTPVPTPEPTPVTKKSWLEWLIAAIKAFFGIA